MQYKESSETRYLSGDPEHSKKAAFSPGCKHPRCAVEIGVCCFFRSFFGMSTAFLGLLASSEVETSGSGAVFAGPCLVQAGVGYRVGFRASSSRAAPTLAVSNLEPSAPSRPLLLSSWRPKENTLGVGVTSSSIPLWPLYNCTPVTPVLIYERHPFFVGLDSSFSSNWMLGSDFEPQGPEL